ncbi:hypothetical protein [Daejeonella lutea]|uniref:Uncharacterized protein n=1 Tax=Daejeonella lutea TaxID=572036 RepID=A0A1T5BX30_9SPHI|nr:hypothetical protein [Daejeonella lutea]SKB51553.1 hypothetical protein SAMN05661099_1701 [Daejeonella lutea]
MIKKYKGPFFKVFTKCCCCVIGALCFTAFRSDELLHKLALETQHKLSTLHSLDMEAMKLKKSEITISDEGFLRYRKTFLNGKQEYYSLNVSRLRDLNYWGTTGSGRLNIKTIEDDVIVQTYNDRAGNVDSMSVLLSIPMKDVDPQELISIQHNLFEIKRLVGQN